MPTAIARVSCPVCRTEFQTYIEQVLDARVDPGTKSRVLGGSVNVAVCPRCGNGGALNLPFIYHDLSTKWCCCICPWNLDGLRLSDSVLPAL